MMPRMIPYKRRGYTMRDIEYLIQNGEFLNALRLRLHWASKRKNIQARIRLRMTGHQLIYIGDKVQVKGNYGEGYDIDEYLQGQVGYVLDASMADIQGCFQRPNSLGNYMFGVYFPSAHYRLHNLNGSCPNNHGWYIRGSWLNVIERIEER